MLLMNFVIIVPADCSEIIGWNLLGIVDIISGYNVYNTMTMIRRYGVIGMSMVITVPADVLALYVYVTPIIMVIVNWDIRLDVAIALLADGLTHNGWKLWGIIEIINCNFYSLLFTHTGLELGHYCDCRWPNI